MHRSRLPVLVIVAALAACSAPEDPKGATGLAQDTTLAARIDAFQSSDKRTDKLPFPNSCGTFSIPDPTAENTSQAKDIARRAYTAEMLGNMREASSLLQRASDLDGTDKSTAYHLGRVSEALHDRSSAIRAYCRFLALAPTSAEAVEARQRVLDLSQTQGQVATTTTPRATKRQPIVDTKRVIARADVDRSSRVVAQKPAAHSTTSIASGALDLPVQRNPATPSPEPQRRADTVMTESDGVETTPVSPTPATVRTEPRGPNRAQRAGIGAVAGAILGGVTGRSAKAAAIGAAAGGILGAVIPTQRAKPR